MSSESEQSAGVVLLLALAFLVGYAVPFEVPEADKECYNVTRGDYIGRDGEGRPEWRYYLEEVCDE